MSTAQKIPADEVGRTKLESELLRYLEAPPFSLRFPAHIESEFEADVRAARVQRIHTATIRAIIFVALMAVTDRAFSGDRMLSAWVVRLVMIAILATTAFVLLPRIGPAPRREALVSVMMVLVGCAQAYIDYGPSDRGVLEQSTVLILLILYANLSLRLRQRFVIPVTMGLILLLGVTILAGSGRNAADFAYAGVIICAIVFTAYATQKAMELEQRRFYAAKTMNQLNLLRLETANARLSEQAYVDALTGLSNRRELDQRFARLYKHALRTQTPICVLFVDVDYFKLYNDTYGHQAGDDCLMTLSAVLRAEVLRPMDVTARYGGEEFVVILPETEIDGASRLGGSIHHRIYAAALPHGSSPLKRVTVSIGIAGGIPTQGATPELLLQAADRALYAAKASGRNAIHVDKRAFAANPPLADGDASNANANTNASK